MNINNSEILHTTEFIYNLDEYKKGMFAKPNRIERIQHRAAPALCFSIGFWLVARNWLEGHLVGWFTLLSFPFFVILCHILIAIIFNPRISKHYKSMEWLDGLIVNYSFLVDGVEFRSFTENSKTSEEKVLRYRYSNFKEVIETRTNFYLLISHLGELTTFMILKENCTPELIEFIQNLPVKKRYQRK